MRDSFKRLSTVWVAAVVLTVGMAATAKASTVTDLNDITLGGQVFGPSTQDFFTAPAGPGFPSTDVGDITSWVYENENVYTYVYEVTPQMNFISEFNTGFAPLGYNGVKGWDFAEAASAGGAGDDTDFLAVVDPDGTIDWNMGPAVSFWHSGETISFFYQSNLAPGVYDVFNLIDGRAASGLGVVPIPEPASATLLGVLAAAMLRRQRRNRA